MMETFITVFIFNNLGRQRGQLGTTILGHQEETITRWPSEELEIGRIESASIGWE